MPDRARDFSRVTPEILSSTIFGPDRKRQVTDETAIVGHSLRAAALFTRDVH